MAKMVERTCDQCGKPFLARLSQVLRGNGKNCSRRCSAIKGGTRSAAVNPQAGEHNQTLRVARQVQPDLWTRTEQIARIIDPAAFQDGWIIHPEASAQLFAAKLKLEQANALSKAQEILRYLGVNTETDWHAILTRLAGEPPPRTAATSVTLTVGVDGMFGPPPVPPRSPDSGNPGR